MNPSYRFFIVLLFMGCTAYSLSQVDTSAVKKEREIYAPVAPIEHNAEAKWYEKLNIRGYAQLRYNRLLETNPNLGCEQCDRSWGNNGGFFLRRIRIIFFGQIHPRVYVYIQPDFASSVSSSNLHFVQIRDAYFDVGLDKNNEFRFRLG